MYNVYCETAGVETITPCYDDAARTFRKYVREYPSEVVNFDSLEGLAPGETMQDIADGTHSAKRVRVMQCEPE